MRKKLKWKDNTYSAVQLCLSLSRLIAKTMINRFKSLLDGRASVFKNFLALGILQGTNFLIPLIIMPYLVTTIGIDSYGIVSFVQVVMIYFFSLTDYGFAITATQQIATNKSDLPKVSKIFSTVVSTKVVLVLFSAVCIIILLFTVPDLKEEQLTVILGFALVIGQTSLPTWFFQGMEKMKYITYINLAAKLIFTALIFIFINEKGDYPFVLFFFGLGNLISGIIGIVYAIRTFDLKFKFAAMRDIQTELTNGWGLFVANFSITSYMNSNLFILKIFTTNEIVGYYSVAEKIVMAIRQLLSVFSQAIFPHICQLAEVSYSKIVLFFKQVYVPFTLFIILVCALVFSFSEEVIGIFAEKEVDGINNLLRILVFVPIVVCLNIFPSQLLLAYNLRKVYTRIMILGSILNVILNIALASTFEAIGTAVSVIITEIFILLGLYLVAKGEKNLTL